MFKKENPQRKEVFERKYEEHLIDLLQEMTRKVDHKIKRGIDRVDGISGQQMANTQYPELNAYQEQSALEKKEEMENKIQFFTTQAERYGEMGNIVESEKFMEEADKTRKDLEQLRNATENPFLFGKEKNMKVCEVCGAL